MWRLVVNCQSPRIDKAGLSHPIGVVKRVTTVWALAFSAMENSALVIFPIRHSLDLLSETQARQHDCSYGAVYAMVKGFVYWVKSKEMGSICPVEAGVGVSAHRRNSKPEFRSQRAYLL